MPVCCSACQNLRELSLRNLKCPSKFIKHIQVLPSHVDDLNLIPVSELNDLLVEVEEDILTLTLAVQGLVGQTEMGSRES